MESCRIGGPHLYCAFGPSFSNRDAWPGDRRNGKVIRNLDNSGDPIDIDGWPVAATDVTCAVTRRQMAAYTMATAGVQLSGKTPGTIGSGRWP